MKSTSHRNTFVRTISATVLASTVALLSACGGGGGGGGGAAPPAGPTPLAAGTFTKNVEIAAASGSYGGMFYSLSAEARYMFLLTAADISARGKVRSVRFKYQSALASVVSCPNTTIKMGATTVTALSATYASNVNQGAGSLTTVLNNAAVSIPAGSAGGYFNIDLAAPFDYNGKDNLVVEVTRAAACTGDVGVQSATAAYNGVVWAWGGAGTSTSATGTANLASMHLGLIFAGGDNGVETAALPTGNAAPLSTTAIFQRVQMLYNASSINGSGPLTGVALQVGALTTAQTYTYTMKIGHTSLTNLGTTWANNFNLAAPVTVAQSTQFTVPAGVPAGEWIWFPLPGGIFTYNGTDNLLIELTTEAATGNVSLYTHPTTNINRINGDPGSPTAIAASNFAHQIKLRFHGAAVAVMSTGTSSFDDYPFGTGVGGSSKRQYLYRMSELGTGGRITSLACRLDEGTIGTTAATSYANFEVVLGHTTNNTLSTTFASNMTDATTVFSGTYPLAAGLRAGDWIEIPLTTSFIYDPTRNLVVQISGDGAANSYNCDAKGDGTLYLNRHAYASSRTATTATVNSFQNELKLNISK